MTDRSRPDERVGLQHEARQALTAALARVQLVRRRIQRATVDLEKAEADVKRLTEVIERLDHEAP